jgi:CRP/FNR family transcriptional regulator, anaerobic regulatory protein
MVNKLIGYLSLFLEVTPKEKDFIFKKCYTQQYKEGDYFLREGEYCTKIGFIHSGVFRIFVINSVNEEATSYFMDENRFITNLEPFHNNTKATEYIQASTDAEIIVITKDAIAELETMDSKWGNLVRTITEKALLEKVYLRNSFLGENATARYQKFIVQQPEVALRVPLSHIASYLGILPQSLSRIRRNFSQTELPQSKARKVA